MKPKNSRDNTPLSQRTKKIKNILKNYEQLGKSHWP